MTSRQTGHNQKHKTSGRALNNSAADGVVQAAEIALEIAAAAICPPQPISPSVPMPSKPGFSTGGTLDDAPDFSSGGEISGGIAIGETVNSIIATGNSLLENAGELVSGANEIVSGAAGVVADTVPAMIEGVGSAARTAVETVVEGLGSVL